MKKLLNYCNSFNYILHLNKRIPMATEIERKFLILGDYKIPTGAVSVKMQQGYLHTDEPAEVRVRSEESPEETRRTLTIKGSGGLSRTEVEKLLEAEEFDELWKLTEGKRVEKTRYKIPQQDNLLELDVYNDNLEGLTVLEVEFTSEEAASAFNPSSIPWITGEIIDVTEDSGYKNKNLAKQGRPAMPAA